MVFNDFGPNGGADERETDVKYTRCDEDADRRPHVSLDFAVIPECAMRLPTCMCMPLAISHNKCGTHWLLPIFFSKRISQGKIVLTAAAAAVQILGLCNKMLQWMHSAYVLSPQVLGSGVFADAKQPSVSHNKRQIVLHLGRYGRDAAAT